MRLSREMIKNISETIVANLEAKQMAKLMRPRDAVSLRIAAAITENLSAEDKLDEEVKKILISYEAEISKGRMDYRKLFELTKQKLARERGMVL